MDYLFTSIPKYLEEVRIMWQLAISTLLGAVLMTLTACSSESDDAKTGKEHVWKEQTDAIDKAREVESILKRGQEQKKQ